MPSRERGRFQRSGLAFMVLGVLLTTPVLFLVHDPARRPGLLGASEGLILVGALMFLIGWNRRR
ncbi:MAG TPA: hypothetical protein VIM19_16265 [Actinomycetes bacterium]